MTRIKRQKEVKAEKAGMGLKDRSRNCVPNVHKYAPITITGESSLAGAENTTFLAPAVKCACT